MLAIQVRSCSARRPGTPLVWRLASLSLLLAFASISAVRPKHALDKNATPDFPTNEQVQPTALPQGGRLPYGSFVSPGSVSATELSAQAGDADGAHAKVVDGADTSIDDLPAARAQKSNSTGTTGVQAHAWPTQPGLGSMDARETQQLTPVARKGSSSNMSSGVMLDKQHIAEEVRLVPEALPDDSMGSAGIHRFTPEVFRTAVWSARPSGASGVKDSPFAMDDASHNMDKTGTQKSGNESSSISSGIANMKSEPVLKPLEAVLPQEVAIVRSTVATKEHLARHSDVVQLHGEHPDDLPSSGHTSLLDNGVALLLSAVLPIEPSDNHWVGNESDRLSNAIDVNGLASQRTGDKARFAHEGRQLQQKVAEVEEAVMKLTDGLSRRSATNHIWSTSKLNNKKAKIATVDSKGRSYRYDGDRLFRPLAALIEEPTREEKVLVVEKGSVIGTAVENHTQGGGQSASIRAMWLANLTHDIVAEDVSALRLDLARTENISHSHHSALNVNLPCFSMNKSVAPKTLLGAISESGWLDGLSELLTWNTKRRDPGPRLQVNAGASISNGSHVADTALLLAIMGRKVGVVKRLIQANASVFNSSSSGFTPLEIAVYNGDFAIVELLLSHASGLVAGLLDLRAALERQGNELPFSLISANVSQLQKLVPQALWPRSPEERALVGENPNDWVRFYEARVLHSFFLGSRGLVVPVPSSRTEELEKIEEQLLQNRFDSFARQYFSSVMITSVVCGFFCLLTYVVFRLRIFGDFEAPVSLATAVPGAFDPQRCADADLDPSRFREDFPYRSASERLIQTRFPSWRASCWNSSVAFMTAWLGVFSSWLLVCVRIPPAADAYDEDYNSDDDDRSRAEVRERATAMAHHIRDAEVAARIAALGTLLWWLWRAARWMEILLLVLSYFIYSLVATCVAMSIRTEPCSASRSSNCWDNSRLTHALFDVQYGPRWHRASRTVRSTASANTAQGRRRVRNRRERSAGPEVVGADLSSTGSGTDSALQNDLDVPAAWTVDSNSSRCWHHAFLQSGVMHTRHSDYLLSAVPSLTAIVVALVWICHWRPLACDPIMSCYRRLPSAWIFLVYGAPGTIDRFAALVLELLWLGLVGERLFGIASFCRTVALSHQQRHRALLFVSEHPLQGAPSISNTAVSDGGVARGLDEALVWVRESLQYGEFARGLSKVRWHVLRLPFSVAVVSVMICLCLASLGFFLVLFSAFSPPCRVLVQMLPDPTLFLIVGLCLLPPIISALHAAASSNREVEWQCADLQRNVCEMIGENTDVCCVTLRVAAHVASKDGQICWHNGKPLSFVEPAVALVLAAAASALCMVTSMLASHCRLMEI